MAPVRCQGAGGTGIQYTYSQLEGLWINAGGSHATAPIAAAIAEAESGGCSAALNPNDNGGTQTSWGLWQISNGTHQQPVPNIMDPMVNARAAVAKFKAAGWSPWGTYNSGAYKAFLSPGTTPDPNPPAGSGTGQLTSAPAGDCLIGSALNLQFGPFHVPQFCMLTKPQARGIMGATFMVAGAIVLGAGLAFLAVYGLKRTGPGQVIVATAERLPPLRAGAPAPAAAAAASA